MREILFQEMKETDLTMDQVELKTFLGWRKLKCGKPSGWVEDEKGRSWRPSPTSLLRIKVE